MSGLGSSQHARRVATGELSNLGWARLAQQVGGIVASYGDSCWLTDGKIKTMIVRPDGRPYHVDSIARVRRQLRDAEIITCTRVLVGGKLPTSAKFRTSSRGTTVKTFLWRAIEQKNPFSRRERRLKRQEQAAELRKTGELQRTAPRHVSARAIVDPVRMPPVALDPELALLAEQAQQYQERNEARRTSSGLASGLVRAPERPPPDE